MHALISPSASWRRQMVSPLKPIVSKIWRASSCEKRRVSVAAGNPLPMLAEAARAEIYFEFGSWRTGVFD
jgi:hypothetical protein